MHRKTPLGRRAFRLPAPTVAAATVLAVPLVAGAQEGPPGNDGAVKIDAETFDDHPNDEPHVGCTFESIGPTSTRACPRT